MTEIKELVSLEAFELTLDGPLVIKMPPKPEVTEADIDAQLFGYVSNAPKGSGITGLHDLDDAWAARSFPGISSVDELRSVIKERLEQENDFAYRNTKYALCADALVAGLKGDIPIEAVEAGIEDVRKRSETTIHSFGESLPQYLRRTDMSEEQFAARLIEETEHDIALNVALDILVQRDGGEVSDEDLPKYLSIEDIDVFLAEVSAAGKLADAKQAAARVKVMRELIDAAKVA